MGWPRITRPTLLLDEAKCRANIARIAEKARTSAVRLRPHFKTHQSATIAEWYRAAGVSQCTVSSVAMAAYFAKHGWTNITIAFPVNPLEGTIINELAAQIELHVCVENTHAIRLLAPQLAHPVHLWVEIDTGYHRTGVQPDDDTTIKNLLSEINAHSLLRFRGFLAHAGHTYQCRTAAHVRETFAAAEAKLNAVGCRYRTAHADLELSTGDTPGCSLANSFAAAEIRPGNLVFYDLSQTAIGSCTREQIALAVACPVVAVHAEREEIYVHGGSVHLSKDWLLLSDGITTYGQPVRVNESGWSFAWPGSFVKSLSQEHGKIHMPRQHIAEIQVGDVLGIVPVHACLTADAMRQYVTASGERITMMPK